MKLIVNKIKKYLLLLAIPCLMLIYLPFKKVLPSETLWQIVFIGLGGIILALSRSKPFCHWTLSAFWIIILARVTLFKPIVPSQMILLAPKMADTYTKRINALGYIVLLIVFIGLFLISQYKEINKDNLMNMICVAAVLLAIWGIVQKTSLINYLPILKTASNKQFKLFGPFNILAAGTFLAICLPAFYRTKELVWASSVVWLGIFLTGRATGIITAIIVSILYLISTKLTIVKTIIVCVICVFGYHYFNKIDNYNRLLNADRFIVWQDAFKELPVIGHGVSSWAEIYPYYSRDKKYYWDNAHNDFVELIFEVGWLSLIPIILFLGFLSHHLYKLSASAITGVVGVFIGCCGFNLMQIAPIALVACVWIGICFQEILGNNNNLIIKGDIIR